MANIFSLPLEIFEQVVGALSFIDLPHFLQTSKGIKVIYFKHQFATKIRSNRLTVCISTNEISKEPYVDSSRRTAIRVQRVQKISKLMVTLVNSFHSFHFIKSILPSRIHPHFVQSLIMEKPNCRDFGEYFLWCSVPALRLCEFCLDRPQYKFIRVRDALATYGLKRNEILSLPKLKCM